jgi:class 3 adenylate cyclase
MPRIPIFKLGQQVESAPPRLASYAPALSLESLQLGIDNVRHDVSLSPEFMNAAGTYIAKLIAKYGNIENLMMAEPPSKSMFSKFVSAAGKKNQDLKPVLVELHKSALNRAKADGNPAIDLLARASIIKCLRAELNAQYAKALDRCRETLKGYEGVRQQKALEYRETVAAFQIAKKRIIRRVGQELFRILREVERETIATMRRSLFGEQPQTDYQLFLHHFIFLEECRDSYLAAEHYVLIGGFENDPDSFGNVHALACEYIKAVAPEGETADETQFDGWLNAPENAHELVGTGEASERTYKERLQLWVELLEREKLLDLAIAAYEVVPLIQEFSPFVDPQQLKYALVFRKERDHIEKLIEEHGKFSRRNLISAVDRVSQCSGAQRAKIAARLLRDFMLYHRDRRRLEVLNQGLERINLIANEKLRDLSKLNGTLYEFLLPEEREGSNDKPIARHVILKADVRDSSRLTRSLLQREMNPASYFSLNFYDPVNKLIPKYGATKVFVEGDAVILAILEREGDPAFSVARACVMAREMTEIVGGYNQLLQRAGLPSLELGIGISFQDSSPMYLLDGDHRIMISDALNESDRLSSCDKRIRKAMQGISVPFNVYEFRASEGADAELMRYNVGGVRISEAAFNRLREEISLEQCKLDFPRLWGNEDIRYWSALVPVGSDIFRRLLIRTSQAPVVNPAEFALVRWTETSIYEVCTNPTVYAALEKSLTQAK